MERLKKGAAAIRNSTESASLRLKESVKEAKEKLATNPVHPGSLGMDRLGSAAEDTRRKVMSKGGEVLQRIQEKRQYVIGGRTVVQEKQLNEGGYAFVHLARDVQTEQELVLKKILCQDKETLLMARREVEILERLPPHPNLVRYYGHAIDKDFGSERNAKEVVLLFELCPGGHLVDFLEANQLRLSEAKILSVFHDVCTAVSLLHARSPPVQHRDLKLENIILGSNGSFKLCDFGSWSDEVSNPANMDRQEISQLQENIDKYTTMMYRPPEMVDFYQQFEVSEKVDIWMLGCILFTLMFSRHPFQDESTLAISNARYDLPQQPSYSEKLQDLTHWLLARNPEDRPTIGDILDIISSFENGEPLNLPVAVVDQKDRQRRLYSPTLQDMDAPLRVPGARRGSSLSKKKRADGERKPKERSSSTKHRSKSKKEHLAVWANMGGEEAWPSAPSVPQPSCDWASFDPTTSVGSTALPFRQDSVRSGGSSRSGSHTHARAATWGEAPSQGVWPPSSPSGQPSSTNWDPFAESPARTSAHGTSRGSSASRLAHGTPDEGILRPSHGTPKEGYSHRRVPSNVSTGSWPDAPSRQVSAQAPCWPPQVASAWPFAGAGEGASAPQHPPARSACPWSVDSGGASAPPRSPWDPAPERLSDQARGTPRHSLSDRPGEAPPSNAKGPWVANDDPFDWLTRGAAKGP